MSKYRRNHYLALSTLNSISLASIDIDSLIHEGDVTQLLELIKPVTFCKADTEFDGGRIKIDPAFIKVFRISQLISELLLASQEKSHERLTNLQEKYNETEREKEKLSEEILHLKDTLTSAKKELKKRKEMLATTQNEMLGENNGDEYDQVRTYTQWYKRKKSNWNYRMQKWWCLESLS